MQRFLSVAVMLGVLFVGHGAAHAVPILQLYIEGAWYDEATESWVAAPSESSGGDSFKLWTIGNVAGPGNEGAIYDVRLSVAYGSELTGLEITLLGSAASQDFLNILGSGFGDTSVPDNPVSTYGSADWKEEYGWFGAGIPTSNGYWVAGDEVQDWSTPILSSGKALPSHGSFGEGVYWQEFHLGDFDQADSPLADFIPPEDYAESEPFTIFGIDDVFANAAQINVYEVSVNGAAGEVVWFDLYNHVEGKNHAKAKFAPFSHDAHIIPEPAAYLVWLLIGLTWAGSAWMYKYSARWRELEKETAFAAVPAAPGVRARAAPERPRGFLPRVRRLPTHRPSKPR
ncbi:MAG: choice-of-anchor N protein [Planctomycetota bacterium]